MAGSSPVYTSCRRRHAQPSSTRPSRRPAAIASPVVAWRRGGAGASRASLMAAQTAMEEVVYEVLLQQAHCSLDSIGGTAMPRFAAQPAAFI
ncbi:hypothetical protein ZWY2020_049210 [Hordeum vulgare]|nr:hypothetical protein ZWY2020_049210 [Hordeum vulgare]